MSVFSLKAVLIASIFDIVVSVIAGVVLLIVFMSIAQQGLTGTPVVAAKLVNDPSFFLASTILGGTVSVLAGYVAARIAGRGELLNGALSSFLCVAEGIYGIATGEHGITATQTIVAIIASPLLGLAGGYVRKLRKPSVALTGS